MNELYELIEGNIIDWSNIRVYGVSAHYGVLWKVPCCHVFWSFSRPSATDLSYSNQFCQPSYHNSISSWFLFLTAMQLSSTLPVPLHIKNTSPNYTYRFLDFQQVCFLWDYFYYRWKESRIVNQCIYCSVCVCGGCFFWWLEIDGVGIWNVRIVRI